MKRKEVRGDVIVLDYATLQNTNFINCKIVYRGGHPPNLDECDFISCEWIFEGAALNTVAFLRALVATDGFRPFILHGILGIPADE